MGVAIKVLMLAIIVPAAALVVFLPRQSSEVLPPATGGPVERMPAGVPSDEAPEVARAVPQPFMRESPPPPPTGNSAKPAAISAQALKACVAKAGESGTCLDEMFRGFLRTRSTTEALALVKGYEDSDRDIRLSCHPIVHAIGRETFRIKQTVHDSFVACDQTCHSGCYHGAMERFLRGDAAGDDAAGHISEEELKAKARTACDPDQPMRFRFQCLHGLGHALVFFSDYRLEQSLAACDTLADSWSRSSCYGGAFMENVFSATPEKRDLSSSDYHYPCSKLDPTYRSDCYMMQTTRMTEMGLSTEKLFAECRNVETYAGACMQSIGRDLSNDARIGDPKGVAKKCELGATGQEREACTRGVVYALIDNTWDGRYAFPFCAAFRESGDATSCFRASASYLRGTFEKSAGDLLAECKHHAPGSAVCRDEALR